MGFSVDFQREIRTGDRFELLYETERDGIDGQRIGDGYITPALFCRIEASDSFVMTRPMMSSAGMIKRAIRCTNSDTNPHNRGTAIIIIRSAQASSERLQRHA